MTRETLGYVKLEWTCPKCGTRNPGPEKTCVSCGAPQPDDVKFEQAQGQQVSQDETLKKIAEAGPDIHCPYCGTRNPASAKVCSQCGGDISEGARREAGKVVGAYQAAPVRQIPCPNCASPNPETAVKCANCGAPLGKRPAAAAPAPTARPMPTWIWMAVAAFALLCLLGGGGWVISRSLAREDLVGQVAAVEWQTVIEIEELGPVAHQGWQDQIPNNAEVGQCRERVRSVESNEPFGRNYNKVCGTPYTIDTGSGVGQVVQDCQYEVLDLYCEYSVEEWQVVSQLVETGNDFSPFYAAPELAQNQGLGEQSATYAIVFETPGGRYEYNVDSLDEYQQFQIGSEWILTLNGFNQIVGLEPAE
jgi:hypothetical protein